MTSGVSPAARSSSAETAGSKFFTKVVSD